HRDTRPAREPHKRPRPRRRSIDRRVLPVGGQPVAALVGDQEHRASIRSEHRRAEQECRGRRLGQRGRLRRVHPGGLFLARGAQLRRHHSPRSRHPRRAARESPLPHHRCGALRSSARHLRHMAIRAALMSLTQVPLQAQAGGGAPSVVPRRRPGPARPYPPARPDPPTRPDPPARTHPPDEAEKYGYIERDLPYLATLLFIGARCLCLSQVRFELHAPVAWVFMIFTGTYASYQAISLPVNFTGRGFDLAAHQALVGTWHPPEYPAVDIYLPICGEPVDVLENTWTAVLELIASYQGAARAYVLD